MRGRSHRRAAGALAAVAAFGVLLTGCGGPGGVDLPDQVDGDLPDAVVEQIDAATNKAIQGSGATGAIVGVWAPWSGSYTAGIGTTAPEDGADVTADMSFRIGEVTRSMTCDVLYGLDADGELSVEDPVTQYVQNVAGMEDITLKQLCDSTSGIGSSESDVIVQWLRTPDRVWNPRELAARGLLKRSGEPGAAFRSSDAGYLLLGEALTHATGKSAQELYRTYVTDRYELENTLLPPAAGAAPGDNALTGYRTSNSDQKNGCVAPADVTESSSSLGYTDSGMVSTIDDLGQYGQILAARVADDDSGRFDDPVAVDPDGASWYKAIGGVYFAGQLVGQEGSTLGYSTSVWSDPETGMTVAVVLNNSRNDDLAGLLGRQLAAITSRASAAEGQSAPEIGLPWSAEGVDKQIGQRASCPIDDGE